jgi:hypothetical protein
MGVVKLTDRLSAIARDAKIGAVPLLGEVVI